MTDRKMTSIDKLSAALLANIASFLTVREHLRCVVTNVALNNACRSAQSWPELADFRDCHNVTSRALSTLGAVPTQNSSSFLLNGFNLHPSILLLAGFDNPSLPSNRAALSPSALLAVASSRLRSVRGCVLDLSGDDATTRATLAEISRTAPNLSTLQWFCTDRASEQVRCLSELRNLTALDVVGSPHIAELAHIVSLRSLRGVLQFDERDLRELTRAQQTKPVEQRLHTFATWHIHCHPLALNELTKMPLTSL